MTEKQVGDLVDLLPAGELFYRVYTAFEGGMRLISKKLDGTEIRYRVLFDEDDNVSIERM